MVSLRVCWFWTLLLWAALPGCLLAESRVVGDESRPSQPQSGSTASAGRSEDAAADSGTSSNGICARSLCRQEHPCQEVAGGYTCRGQFADWGPAHSATAFSDGGNGTTRDARSGLVWQVALPSTYAPVCSGKYADSSRSDDACTWENAKQYCASLSLTGSRWRLPTVAELESLIDDSRKEPAMDIEAFPEAPSSRFWSTSSRSGAAGNAWYVDFSDGHSYDDGTDKAYRVRCVR